MKVFTRAITQDDWILFKKYARRVRIFNLATKQRDMITVSQNEYHVLTMAAGGRVLLPNITELNCFSTEEALQFIHLFLGQNLTTLTIGTPKPLPPSLLSIFADLGTQHPEITTLIVCMDLEATLTVISTTICHWNNLRCLQVGALSADALVHIATLPSLEVLRLIHDCQSLSTDFPYHLPFAGFPSLQKLLVICPGLSFCTQLVASMLPGVSLTSISFCINRLHPTSAEWNDLLNSIKRTCRHSYLLHIGIWDVWQGLEHPDNRPILTTDHLQLLFPFTNLLSVRLETIGTFDINNFTVAKMAVSWPNIYRLSLVGEATLKPTISLAALPPLAKYCPRLNSLTLAFNATLVPRAKPVQRFHSPLKVLDVLNSPINDSGYVAAFMSDIFPNLNSVVAFGKTATPLNDEQKRQVNLWKEVRGLTRIFASVRAHEIARGKFVEQEL